MMNAIDGNSLLAASRWYWPVLLLLAAAVIAGAACSRPATRIDTTPATPYGKTMEPNMKTEKATFGAGCFWGVEATFRQIPGVTGTAVGYLGGTLENPTYEDVCTNRTGHAEVVEVEYDPSKVAYQQLLDVFWKSHDPTTLNRQGPDVGTQYRSAIFYHTPEQKAAAEASRQQLDQSDSFKRKIVTEITPASSFYRAEDYHQQYLEKRGLATCHIATH